MLIAGEVDRLNCLQTALPMHSKELVGGSAADEIYEGRRDKRSPYGSGPNLILKKGL